MTAQAQVKEMLTQSVATLEPSAALYQRSLARGRTLRRRHRGGAAAALVAAVSAVALTAPWTLSLLTGTDGRVELAAGSPVTLPDAPGTWGSVFTAPVEGRTGHTATWTGDALVVWGGSGADGQALDDGAVWDGRAWRRMAPSPLGARTGHAAVWTGEHVLVVGGTDDADAGPPGRLQAARYDPAADTWELLPPAPLDERAHAAAAWTGDALVVWGGTGVGYPPLEDGARYDAASGAWRRLPAAPLPHAARRPVAVWDGTEVHVWVGTDQAVQEGDREEPLAGAAYDPATDRWRPLPESPLGTAYTTAAVLMDDRVALLAGGRAALYDPGADAWSPLPLPPEAARWDARAVWTGKQLVVWGAASSETGVVTAHGAAYEPGADAWVAVPAGPLAGRHGHTLTWTGTHVLVWGGSDGWGAVADAGGAAYQPWTASDGAVPLDRVEGQQHTPVTHASVRGGGRLLLPTASGETYAVNPEAGEELRVTSVSLAPGSTTAAWRMIASHGAGERALLLLEGRYATLTSVRPLDPGIDSPHVDPRPLWALDGDVFWIEMDGEDSARLRGARLVGEHLEEVLRAPLAIPGDDPGSGAGVEGWDGQRRYWLDRPWHAVELPGGALDVRLRVVQPATDELHLGTFEVRLHRSADGTYEVIQGLTRLDG